MTISQSYFFTHFRVYCFRYECVLFSIHTKNIINLVIPTFCTTFKTLSLLTLYIKAKSSARNGSYFWEKHSKISTLRIQKAVRLSSPKGYRLFFWILSLQNFFRRVLACRQAEQTKNGVLSCSTWTSNYTRRTASSSVQGIVLFLYGSTLCGVSPPHDEPALTPKNRGK